jgi:myo-inositol-1(or 4)-monophosphatase
MENMQPMLNIAETAALEAGKIIMQHADRLDRVKIQAKGYNDLVTDVDTKSQQAIVDTILRAYPTHHILAEEDKNNDNPYEIVCQDKDYLWIIDPLDGTVNFAHGFPVYNVSIALQYRGKLQVAVIYDPVKNELFSALRGKGALLDHKRIRVSTNKKLPMSLLGTGFPFKYPEYQKPYIDGFAKCMAKTAGIRRAGAAALDLAYVACGRLEGFWEFGLQPWDMAAGILLITEAGGLCGDITEKNNPLASGHIITANPHIYQPLRELVKVNSDQLI